MLKRLKLWLQQRRDERLRNQIENAQMEAVIRLAWQSGRPVVGLVHSDGTMTIEYADRPEVDIAPEVRRQG